MKRKPQDVIENMILKLAKKFPNRAISIRQEWFYHKNSIKGLREMERYWDVYVEDNFSEDFETLLDVRKFINDLCEESLETYEKDGITYLRDN